MKKVLCTIGAGDHARLIQLNRPGRERFAARHGYELVERYDLPDPGRPASWSKLALVDELLGRADVVLWVDADTAFVDDRRDPSAQLTRRRWMGLVSHEYDGQHVPNLGVFAMRASRGARRLLRRLSRMTQYDHHMWWENAAFLDLLGYDVSSLPIRKVRPSRLERRLVWLGVEFNSIPIHPADRPIINHYPGLGLEERVARVSADIAGWR